MYCNFNFLQCTKPCGGGTQRRSVKCLEYDIKMNALRESTQCRYTTREPIYRTCNTEKCEGGFYIHWHRKIGLYFVFYRRTEK